MNPGARTPRRRSPECRRTGRRAARGPGGTGPRTSGAAPRGRPRRRAASRTPPVPVRPRSASRATRPATGPRAARVRTRRGPRRPGRPAAGPRDRRPGRSARRARPAPARSRRAGSTRRRAPRPREGTDRAPGPPPRTRARAPCARRSSRTARRAGWSAGCRPCRTARGRASGRAPALRRPGRRADPGPHGRREGRGQPVGGQPRPVEEVGQRALLQEPHGPARSRARYRPNSRTRPASPGAWASTMRAAVSSHRPCPNRPAAARPPRSRSVSRCSNSRAPEVIRAALRSALRRAATGSPGPSRPCRTRSPPRARPRQEPVPAPDRSSNAPHAIHVHDGRGRH